jgi:hypothetical protein
LKRSIPPKLTSAARRASSALIPRRTFFAVCMSMWNRISSSSSGSAVRRRSEPASLFTVSVRAPMALCS